MNYMDYREALGLGVYDKEKNNAFINNVLNYLENHPKTPFSRESYIQFCNIIGIRANPEELTFSPKKIVKQPKGLQIVLPHFDLVKGCFQEFLVFCVALLNTYKENDEEYRNLKSFILSSIIANKLSLEPIEDIDGMFFFPVGAKELDSALVSEPLEWLKEYPKTHAIYSRALKKYSERNNASDVADDFRKALEQFLREFQHNDKDLDNNRSEICKYLKEKGADNNITSMLGTLLQSYKKINDEKAKHNDKIDPRFLEFVMYQTGVFIRMIITVEKNR